MRQRNREDASDQLIGVGRQPKSPKYRDANISVNTFAHMIQEIKDSCNDKHKLKQNKHIEALIISSSNVVSVGFRRSSALLNGKAESTKSKEDHQSKEIKSKKQP
jgi:hypothetical protein